MITTPSIALNQERRANEAILSLSEMAIDKVYILFIERFDAINFVLMPRQLVAE